MTDEIDTSYPERIWARVEPDWHEGITGENFVGGMFDAGYFRDGVPYVRADLYEDERQRAEKAEASEADAVAEYHSIRRELSDILLLRNALRTRAENAEAEKLRLRGVACEAMIQLIWLNEKEQRGSTNTVLARLEHALRQDEGGE